MVFSNEHHHDLSFLKGLVGAPLNPIAIAENDLTRELLRVPMPRVQQPTSTPVPRRAMLYHKYFWSYEYTEGCPKCKLLKRCGSDRSEHNNNCRERMEAIMACDSKLKKKLDEARARADYWLAEEVARCDERRQRTEVKKGDGKSFSNGLLKRAPS